MQEEWKAKCLADSSPSTKQNLTFQTEVRKLFSELGAEVGLVNENELFRTIVTGPDGYDVTLSAGWEEFKAGFAAACPGAEKSLDRLEALFKKTDEALIYNDMKRGKPNKLKMMINLQ